MLLAISLAATFISGADDIGKRKDYLEQLRRILPASEAWDAWLEETGELPPDFEALPSVPNLPDPLIRTVDGGVEPVETPEAWPARRTELLRLFQQWVIGSVPPPPDNVRAEILSEREQARTRVRQVRLVFGPGRTASVRLELLIPAGAGPFPVFMTQHNHRAWGLIALRRGYVACIYAGADSMDDTDSFSDAYPDYDWSRLTRRAWAAGRCIDYLERVPEADTKRVALTGHSRNGKQSLIASALDERIAVVISSSSGAGGCMPTRYYTEQQFGEGIELLTRRFPDWFHPRLRFFTGREQKLPVDFNQLVAMSAPRPCLLSIALNDSVEDAWAMEQTYRSAKDAYQLLGVPEHLRILWRPAAHETWPTVIERYLDWCDVHFAGGSYAFPERLMYPWDWGTWRERASGTVRAEDFEPHGFDDLLVCADGKSVKNEKQWETKRSEISADVRSMLGVAPSCVGAPEAGTYGKEPEHIERLLGRNAAGSGLAMEHLVFGEYINADVYLPEGSRDAKNPLPTVLWLHPACASRGYVPAYNRGEVCYRAFARAGYAVFCYDQIGYGRRIEEVEGFYDRHPDWSLLGKMLRDARAALDTLGTLPYVDSARMYVVGYSMGALVAAHLAAVEDRPAGYALVSPPQPFRLDTLDAGTGGITRWGQIRMLLPRLGHFEGEETRVPYDLHALVAAIAPRPALIVTPQLDRECIPGDVGRAVDAAREVYALHGASKRLTHLIPEDYSHFDPDMHSLVLDWLNAQN